jgi:DNA-binding XRE family transcriptional regulator
MSSISVGEVGPALAKTVGVVHESISRWENGVLPGSSLGRLARVIAG